MKASHTQDVTLVFMPIQIFYNVRMEIILDTFHYHILVFLIAKLILFDLYFTFLFNVQRTNYGKSQPTRNNEQPTRDRG